MIYWRAAFHLKMNNNKKNYITSLEMLLNCFLGCWTIFLNGRWWYKNPKNNLWWSESSPVQKLCISLTSSDFCPFCFVSLVLPWWPPFEIPPNSIWTPQLRGFPRSFGRKKKPQTQNVPESAVTAVPLTVCLRTYVNACVFIQTVAFPVCTDGMCGRPTCQKVARVL